MLVMAMAVVDCALQLLNHPKGCEANASCLAAAEASEV